MVKNVGKSLFRGHFLYEYRLRKLCIYYVYTTEDRGVMMEGHNKLKPKLKPKPKPNQGVRQVTTTVQKWGNSLAVRIPSGIAETISIKQGSEMELSVENQVLTLRPTKKKPTLEDLLSKISPENRHSEIDFGEVEGNELM
jgi:antitoxin MazE